VPPEGAQSQLRPDETNYLESFKENALVGSIDNVERKLRKLATHLQIDELVIITWTHDHSVQRRSYELLADAFELNGQAVN
jgi:alkanesulfonate monooxygenase SsuD/methylene tetrahydromethanopterin reductase-like flavin-dependent oxidoreductase (luciferase family)